MKEVALREPARPPAVRQEDPLGSRRPAHQAARQPAPSGGSSVSRHEQVALVDLLDRVLAGGVVIAGEVTLSLADVDMVTISLRALISSAGALIRTDTEQEE